MPIRSAQIAYSFACLAALGCNSKASTKPSVVIGAVLPYSGAIGATIAGALEGGVRTAEQLINAQGGVLGKAFHVQTIDGGSDDPGVAQRAAETLVQQDGAQAIVGPFTGDQLARVGAWASQAGPVLVSPTNIVQPQGPYIFGLTVGAAWGVLAAARDMQNVGFARIVVFDPNDDASFSTALQARLAVIAPQAQVTRQAVPDVPGGDYSQWDATSTVQQALASVPDCAVLNTAGGIEAGAIMSALAQQGFGGTVYVAPPHFGLPPGVDPSQAQGMRQIAQPVSDGTSKAYVAFLQAYLTWSHGKPPSSATGLEQLAFDATMWLGLALQRTTQDTAAQVGAAIPHVLVPGGQPLGPGDVAQALQRLARGEDIAWQGAAGTLALSPDGTLLTAAQVQTCCDASGNFIDATLFAPDAL